MIKDLLANEFANRCKFIRFKKLTKFNTNRGRNHKRNRHEESNGERIDWKSWG